MAKFGTTLGRMTFGQRYPPVEISHIQAWNYFGQADLWLDVPPVETFCGLVWNYFGQDDLWSMYPAVETSHGPGLVLLWAG